MNDDVSLLLNHPDSLEQAMALKLSGLARHHIVHIFKNKFDTSIKQQALASKLIDKWLLIDLIDVSTPADLFFVMDHSQMDAECLMFLWNRITTDTKTNYYPLIQKLAYKKDLPESVQKSVFQLYPECIHGLMKNNNLSLDIIAEVLDNYKAFPKSIVYSIVQSPMVSVEFLTKAIKNYKDDLELAMIAIKHSSLPEAVAKDIVKHSQIDVNNQELQALKVALTSNPSKDIQEYLQFETKLNAFTHPQSAQTN